jgi:hypothetical protein
VSGAADYYAELVRAQQEAGAAVGGDPFLLPMPLAADDAGWAAVKREYFRLADESGGVCPHFILDSELTPFDRERV